MNRREFLLAFGATACSGRAAPVEEPEPDIPAPADAAVPMVGVPHPSFTNTNLAVSPLAVHQDVVVHRVGDELRVWDLATTRRVAAYTFPLYAFTLLVDGSIVAFGQRAVELDCAVYRIANGVKSTYPTWGCDESRLLLRTGSLDSIYSVRTKEIVRFRFDRTTAERDATIPIPVLSLDNRGQMFSLDDGRIVAPGDGISILAPGTPAVRRPMPKVYPRHLARATAERFWYTRAGHRFGVVDTLVLTHLDTPHRDARVVTFAPSRIVHVASHGAAIAVLLMSPREGWPEETWHVAVVDEAGMERWRAEVPRQREPFDLNYSAVALADKRLVLATPSGELLAWDAATGAVT